MQRAMTASTSLLKPSVLGARSGLRGGEPVMS